MGRGAQRGIAVVMGDFPTLFDTDRINRLRSLERAGLLAVWFARSEGISGGIQPAVRALLGRHETLPEGGTDRQARFVAGRLARRPVRAIHALAGCGSAEVAFAAARILGVPFGFSTRRADLRGGSKAALERCARRARCVVACDPEAAREIARTGAEVYMVPHGVDLGGFAPQPLPAEQPLPLRLLAAGRFTPGRGFDYLILAAAKLSVPFRLRIAGAGPEASRLEAFIRETGLGDRIELVPAMTHRELPAEFAAAHAVVIPSASNHRGDGPPAVLREAMSSCRAVVASDRPELRAAVEHLDSALLVPPGRPGELCEALELLARRPALREKLAARAWARALRHHDLARCGERFARCLEEAYA